MFHVFPFPCSQVGSSFKLKPHKHVPPIIQNPITLGKILNLSLDNLRLLFFLCFFYIKNRITSEHYYYDYDH